MLHMTVFNCGREWVRVRKCANGEVLSVHLKFTGFFVERIPRNHPAASSSVVHLCRRACPTQSGMSNPPILSTFAHELGPSAASTTKKPSQNIGPMASKRPAAGSTTYPGVESLF